MKWFKKDTENKVSDRVAGSLAGWLIRTQTAFASGLHKKTGNWNQRQKKMFLAVVCIAFISFSISAITQSFKVTAKIKRPDRIVMPTRSSEIKEAIISEDEFKNVQRFKSTLDSITIKQRPGLVDSIRMVEEMYYSQQK